MLKFLSYFQAFQEFLNVNTGFSFLMLLDTRNKPVMSIDLPLLLNLCRTSIPQINNASEFPPLYQTFEISLNGQRGLIHLDIDFESLYYLF